MSKGWLAVFVVGLAMAGCSSGGKCRPCRTGSPTGEGRCDAGLFCVTYSDGDNHFKELCTPPTGDDCGTF